jgi:hypothetical protein
MVGTKMLRSGSEILPAASASSSIPTHFGRNSAQGGNRLAHRATRPGIARLGQGNFTAMALKNHLFPNVIASRNHASELHPLGTSWARGTMTRGAMVLGHVPIMDVSLANL